MVATLRRAGRRLVLRLAGFLDPDNPVAISKSELDTWIKEGVAEYPGPLSDVRPAIENAHCVVLPSYREGVPRCLLEAAAMGRPIITTDTPGCRDALLADKSGFLCAPKNAASLAACMARMPDLSAERLTEMGRLGRRYMKDQFSESLVLDAYLQQCIRLRGRAAQ